MTYFYVAEDR